MKKSKNIAPIPPKSEGEELFDAVLGPDEELSDQVSRKVLETYGITGERLVDKLKTRLQGKIKQIHDETGKISEPLEATLKNVREYQKEKVPKPISADVWINGMFDGKYIQSAHEQPLYSFRNCEGGEVSENDKQILSSLKAELGNEEE
jgi:hypothetical protein